MINLTGSNRGSGKAAARIYQDMGNGQVLETEFVQTPAGRVLRAPTSVKARVLDRSQIPAQCPVISQNSINNSMNQNQIMRPGGITPGTIRLSEDAYGNVRDFRSETADLRGNLKVINITVSNAESSGGPDTILLGDGNGILALAATYGGLAPGSLRSGITISGTWGTSTNTILQNLSRANPLDVHELQLQGYDTSGNPDSSFFTGGFIKLARAKFNGDAAEVSEIPLQFLTSPQDYNTYIRQTKDFRFTIDAQSGILLNLPIGKSVQITMKLSAVSETYGMNKV